MHYIMTTTTAKTDCRHGQTIGWGKDRQGNARRRCKDCGKVISIVPPRPLGRMRISLDDATLVLSLLTEGSSIRSAERVSGIHRASEPEKLADRVAMNARDAPV